MMVYFEHYAHVAHLPSSPKLRVYEFRPVLDDLEGENVVQSVTFSVPPIRPPPKGTIRGDLGTDRMPM